MGLTTPLGFGVEATRKALAAGTKVSGTSARVEAPLLRAQVPEDLEGQVKFLNGSGLLAGTAADEAITQSRLAEAGHEPATKGLFLAQVDQEVLTFQAYRPAFADATDEFTKPPPAEALNTATLRKMNPFHLLETIQNNAFSFLSAWHGLRGSNTSLSGWAAVGLEALSLAARTIVRGDAAAAVACAASRLSNAVVSVETRHWGALPAGIVPSEGAAALVLEPLAIASRRGVTPLAVVLGDGAGVEHVLGTDRAESVPALLAAADEALSRAGIASGELLRVVSCDTAVARKALASDPRVKAAEFTSHRASWGHLGPTGDLAEAILAIGDFKGSSSSTRRAVLVLAWGLEGQAYAVVLATP